jgi:hypothetical protein
MCSYQENGVDRETERITEPAGHCMSDKHLMKRLTSAEQFLNEYFTLTVVVAVADLL